MVKMVKNLRPFIFVIGVSPTLFYVNAIIQTSPPIISRSVRGGTGGKSCFLGRMRTHKAQQTGWVIEELIVNGLRMLIGLGPTSGPPLCS